MKSQLAAPDMTAKADIPGDSRFARALASSDFHTRSKGLEALHVWLQRKQNVPEMGLQKIWRGIMFCFWHSDKIQVQEQLADELVKIMMDLSDEVWKLPANPAGHSHHTHRKNTPVTCR